MMKRTASKCDECPLRDKPWAPPEHPEHPAIALVGEALGEEEERTGRAFVGRAGGWLMSALSEANILRNGCWVTNVLPCRPPDNDIKSYEAELAMECCKPGLDAELEAMKSVGVKVVVALGRTAARAITGIGDTVESYRGSITMRDGVPVLTTFHPSYIMRSQEQTPVRGERKLSSHILRPVWVQDLIKARRIADEGWVPPKEKFLTYPNVNAAVGLMGHWIDQKFLIAVDIETTGWRPETGEIVVVGLAVNGEEALSIPFLKQGGERYWTDIDWQRVRTQLAALLAGNPLVFQNAKFDVNWLETKGFEVGHIAHDVMLLHHAVNPELPHDLGFIVSIHGSTPYWKGEVLGRDRDILDVPDTELRTYNLRDAVVLHQVLPSLMADLEELGPEAGRVYREISLELIRPIMAMEKRGMKVSASRLANFRRELKDEINLLDIKARVIGRVGPEFNINSDEDMRLLLYGIVGKKFDRAEEDIVKKKRTDTKVYAELKRIVVVKKTTEPFYVKPPKRTKTSASVDEEALLTIMRQSTERKELIERFKRPTDDHLEEHKELSRLIDFVSTIMQYNAKQKLATTYTSYPIEEDGRVHPSFLIHGTATGRLSCKNPNLQNQPDEARKIFVADEGCVLVQADYSNLELRVLAYAANDPTLQEPFLKGENVHDANTRELFGVQPDHPSWKALRRAAKVYIFGRNYGGGIEGMYRRVSLQVPEAQLSFQRFKAVDERYRAMHPGYTAWAEQTRRAVLDTRRGANLFGRVRTFYGNEQDIAKEGLNHPIQSSAADIINPATISLWKLGLPIVCQVHDSLLFEVKEADLEEAKKVIRREMERGFAINGQHVTFPVDISVGRSWGELA